MIDELDFERAATRIARNMAWIAGTGSIAAFAARGWPWGAGFLLGASASWLNFRWLRRLVRSLGGEPPGKFKFALRYLILGLGAYAVLRYSSVSLPAVGVGLLVLTAAVFIEVIVEFASARKQTPDHHDLQ